MSRYLSFLKSLPVAVNMGIGFAIMMVLTFGVAGAALFGIRDIEERDSLAQEVQRAVELMNEARLAEKDFSAHGAASAESRAITNIESFIVRIEALKGIQRARKDRVIRLARDHERAFASYVTTVKEPRRGDSGVMDRLEEALGVTATELDADMDRAAREQQEESEARTAATKGLLVAGTIAALILGIVAAIFTNRLIIPGLERAVVVANRVAEGDLSVRIVVDRKDEIGRLLGALSTMSQKLGDIVGRVRGASGTIAGDAENIAVCSEDLSEKTKGQAASLEETNASLQELTAAVKQNTNSALSGKQLATAAREEAQKGSDVLSRTVTAMEGIRTASDKIKEIIGVIDEIAFQTNLLALNAAVEAARAGDEGRGFAVVAAEIRKLAHRSADAAKEIAALIRSNVARVEDGSHLVRASGESLHGILSAVERLGATVEAISAASEEQSSGIDQVSSAMMQIDAVTQRNAAIVEEVASAGASLDAEARSLKGLIGYFKLGKEAPRDGRSAAESRLPVSTLPLPQPA